MISTKQRKFIQYKLYNDSSFLEDCILKLYEKQTNDEQQVEYSKYHNKEGFNAADAKQMSVWAKNILNNKHLDTSEISVARKRLFKYVNQIGSIINREYAQKVVEDIPKFSSDVFGFNKEGRILYQEISTLGLNEVPEKIAVKSIGTNKVVIFKKYETLMDSDEVQGWKYKSTNTEVFIGSLLIIND